MDYVKAVLYGNYGTGKTCFLASGIGDPRCKPGLLINAEAGTKSITTRVNHITLSDLLREDFVPGNVPGKLDTVRVKNWGELSSVLDILYNNAEKAIPSYGTVMVDSLTEINRYSLQEAKAVNEARPPKNYVKDPSLPSGPDYNRSLVQMGDIVRDFRDLDAHVIFTALPAIEKSEGDGLTYIKPKFIGQLATDIPAMVDLVLYLSVDKNKKRTFRAQPTDLIEAKDRIEGSRLGEVAEDLTLPTLFDLLGIPLPEVPVPAPTGRKGNKSSKSEDTLL